ncbi:MAG: RagB/SusD family nutrient uptake outer membrane protein [Prevotella sp.]|nr:RagB/SusD family nutrient uptake outer membrane protein [Prevotella sp.]
MKYYSYIFKTVLCAAFVLGLSSCGNDWLEEEQPASGVNAETAIQKSSDMEAAYVGMYTAFKGTSDFTDYYAANMFVYGDVSGEDLQYNNISGSNRASLYYYRTYTTADQFGTNTAVWRSPYIVISRANHIITVDESQLEDAEEAAAEIAMMKNEAKVLRAYALFDLTRVYGKPYTQDGGASLGVPFSEDILNAEDKLPRSTVAENYAQIVKDLTEAINSGALHSDRGEGHENYITLWAAEALLSRVYLTMGDYNKALAISETLMDQGWYVCPRDNYVGMWDKAGAQRGYEVIFEIGITGTSDWTDRNGIAYLFAENGGENFSGYGDIIATKAFVDMLSSDPEDIRNDVFLPANSDAKKSVGDARVFLNKLPPHGGSPQYQNIPMLRISEVYLNAAEAAFNIGNKEKAANYLNEIIKNRTTDESKQVTAATVTADRIYIERRKELVGEGQRWFDALRRGETITRYTSEADRGWHDVLTQRARTYNRESKYALPPIPQYEIDANPEIIQNADY